MAMTAVARETVFALRRQIAKIKGTLPERLQAPAAAAPDVRVDAGPSIDVTIVRRGVATALPDAFLSTGVERLDAALSGGLPKCSVIRPSLDMNAGAQAAVAFLTSTGLFEGQSKKFFKAAHELAREADAAQRGKG